jgi:hypothetical protein
MSEENVEVIKTLLPDPEVEVVLSLRVGNSPSGRHVWVCDNGTIVTKVTMSGCSRAYAPCLYCGVKRG